MRNISVERFAVQVTYTFFYVLTLISIPSTLWDPAQRLECIHNCNMGFLLFEDINDFSIPKLRI